jgi:hypothetical protein
MGGGVKIPAPQRKGVLSMQIKKVNRLIFDSTEKQTLRNASILISQISRSMEENEIDDDFPVSLDDLVYGIDELINREYIGY